mgnify:CR=1 FL=1
MKINPNHCRYILDDGTQCLNEKVQGVNFCEEHANWLPADLEVYGAITEHFRQDVREFWSRSNLYLVVQVGLLSVFSIIPNSSSVDYKVVSSALSILGLIIAIVWFIVLRGAVLWIQRWREQTIRIDNVIDGHHIYKETESFAYSHPLMSPSYVTQYLPIAFCITWIVLLFFIWGT